MKLSMKNKAPSLKKIKSGLSFRRSKILQKGTRKSTVAGIPDAVSFESNADAKKADAAEEKQTQDAVMNILENKASEMSVSSAEEKEAEVMKEADEAPPAKEMEAEEPEQESMEPEQEPAPQEPEELAPEPEVEEAKLEPEETATEEEEPKEEEEAAEEEPAEEDTEALADLEDEEEPEEEPKEEDEEEEEAPESPNQEAMDADIEAVQQSGRVAIGFCTPNPCTNEEEAPATEEENVFTHALEMMGQYLTCFPSAAPQEGEVAVIDTTAVKTLPAAAPITPTEELSPEMDDRNDAPVEEPAALEMEQQEIRV